MKRKISTKACLISAALVLAIAFTAFIGTTFAWFTDSVTSGRNQIKSGTLDIAMNYWDKDTDQYLDATDAILFDENALWEPGFMDIAYVEIKNVGSLAFNYLFVVYPNEERAGYLASGEEFYLSDYLVFGIAPYDVQASGEIQTREDAMNLIANAEMGISDNNSQVGWMKRGDPAVKLALIVYMPTTVTSNQANHDLNSGKPGPQLKLSVDLYATQKNFEKDSFDENYDSGLTPVWDVPLWRYAPEGGYTVDSESKKITVNNMAALKYLGELYDDMMTHPLYDPSEWDIVLGSDIDFGGEVLTEPIRFGGFKSFDGNNKTITNVILNYIYVDEYFESVGLFDELPSTKDITLTNVTVTSETTAAGILAGNLVGDSYSNITISDSGATGVGFIGGMIGWGNFLLPIDFSGIQILRTDLSLFGSGSGSAGGIAGYYGGSSANVSGTTVKNLNATGVSNTGSYVGGLFGEIEADAVVGESTVTEITVYKDVYIGSVTGRIYDEKTVSVTKTTIPVQVKTESGELKLVKLTGEGDIEDSDLAVDNLGFPTSALHTTHEGHYYQVFQTTSDITWLAAKANCESKYGHLVTITTAAENTAVAGIVRAHSGSAWLGAYRTECHGSHNGPHTFAWVTGEEWVYSNWDSGEPNDSHPHEGACENSLHMYSSGLWNDYQNDHSNMRGYVCEWDSLQSYLNYLTSN